MQQPNAPQKNGHKILLSANGSKPATFLIYSLEQAYRHMTRQRDYREQELYLKVDEILFYVWDPLCISIDQLYREEYLPYLPHVFDLMLASQNGEELLSYLVFVEENKFGVTRGDNLARLRARRCVEILMEYRHQLLGR